MPARAARERREPETPSRTRITQRALPSPASAAARFTSETPRPALGLRSRRASPSSLVATRYLSSSALAAHVTNAPSSRSARHAWRRPGPSRRTASPSRSCSLSSLSPAFLQAPRSARWAPPCDSSSAPSPGSAGEGSPPSLRREDGRHLRWLHGNRDGGQKRAGRTTPAVPAAPGGRPRAAARPSPKPRRQQALRPHPSRYAMPWSSPLGTESATCPAGTSTASAGSPAELRERHAPATGTLTSAPSTASIPPVSEPAAQDPRPKVALRHVVLAHGLPASMALVATTRLTTSPP